MSFANRYTAFAVKYSTRMPRNIQKRQPVHSRQPVAPRPPAAASPHLNCFAAAPTTRLVFNELWYETVRSTAPRSGESPWSKRINRPEEVKAMSSVFLLGKRQILLHFIKSVATPMNNPQQQVSKTLNANNS